MKITATFEDGALSLLLMPETNAEQRMVGAVIDQPEGENSNAVYLDPALVRVTLGYSGHWTNKNVSSMKLSVYRPGEEPK